MDIKNFVLSYYKNSADDFYVHRVEKAVEARKPHTHDYFQIYYVLRGKLLHYVEKDYSSLSIGDMFIIPPGVKHYIDPEEGAAFYVFSFMPDYFGEQNVSNKLALNFLKSLQINAQKGIRPKIVVPDDELFTVENIFERAIKEFSNKPFGYSETIRAYALLLVSLVARHYFESVGAEISNHFETSREYVLYCVKYIEENFTENISLEDITHRFAMSKSCFCKLFAEITGHSFNNYLNMCRVKKSTEYIKEGYKITAIYGLCGYNDFSTFYRNFKKIMGISPAKYKLEHL